MLELGEELTTKAHRFIPYGERLKTMYLGGEGLVRGFMVMLLYRRLQNENTRSGFGERLESGEYFRSTEDSEV